MANCVLTSDPQTRRIVIGFDRAHCAADESGVRLHTFIRDYLSQRLDPSLASGYRPSHGALVHSQQDFGICVCVWLWGLRPRVGKGFKCRSVSRKPSLICPLHKHIVLPTNNKTSKAVVSLHNVQSTASVRTPTLGRCR
jgi:hypothetical protein